MFEYPDRVIQISEIVANDQDKTITPPMGGRFLYGVVELVTTADVGNRVLRVDIRDSSNTVVYTILSPVNHAASLTRQYLLIPGGAREAAFVGTSITLPLPRECVLLDGWDIRVIEGAGIEVLDDMTLQFVFAPLTRIG